MPISSKQKCLFAGFLLLSSLVQAELTVFACEPEWGAVAKSIVPDAKIYNATTSMQDPHQVQARPSLISMFHKADIAFCSGAGLEAGWLPALQQKAANPKIMEGKPGFLMAANQVETIEKHDHASPIMGDIHPEGNPHLHLDPYRLLQVAKVFSERAIEINPVLRKQYSENFAQFADNWNQNITRWEEKAKLLRGMKVIAYHSNFNYLFQWLGIEMVGDLEPKPGLPPTDSHLASLLKITNQTKVNAIIYSSYQDGRKATSLGEKTNVPVLELPFSVGETPDNATLEALYNSLINQLLAVKQKSHHDEL